METLETVIPEVKILIPRVFVDDRGYFFESWNQNAYAAAGINANWVQDNESRSRLGVLRGLHFQRPPHAQAKLVRVVVGAVLDVAVDVRKGSPWFGKHVAVELTADNHRQLFVPRGFAHGFAVLSDVAVFQYKCDNFYHPESEAGIAWDDPDIAVDWRLPAGECILSDKDARNPRLADAAAFSYPDRDWL